MSSDVRFPRFDIRQEYFVPGTGFACNPHAWPPEPAAAGRRNSAWRRRYLARALDQIPRLLSAVDRNPFRKTYGCLDRQFWHYRTAAFPSEMYQEGVLPLAMVYAEQMPGNRWHGDRRVKELAVAAMRFAARSSHADGSCDDYYPFERALGAAVFSLAAAARAYQLLGLDDAELWRWFERRGRWLIDNDESGRLANHQALAALGLVHLGQITGKPLYKKAAAERVERVLAWQSDEGWFEEYGGADPGYQTVTIDCLAKIRRISGDARLDEPLRRAVDFAALFLHPDHSFGGPYGSRGTSHFYPHGFELLARHDSKAARLADGFLAGLADGSVARFDDDRMFAHRLANLIEAYVDWSPARPASPPPESEQPFRHLPQAGMLIRRAGGEHTVISSARGGSFVHFAPGRPPASDAGLIVETSDGRLAVSHRHDRLRPADFSAGDPSPATSDGLSYCVSGPLSWARFETATPIKQAVFHAGMCSVGRWCRTTVRRLLQRRLISGGRECPIRLTRLFEFLPGDGVSSRLRVTDTIELTEPGVRVGRMAFGGDHESSYVAAGSVYQPSLFTAWTDLAAHVDALNAGRRVTIVRQF